MIVLHPSLTDELVEFTDVESITTRQRYAPDVDPSKVTLLKPIGVYRFRDKIPCGLKNCHTPHNRGLVALTSDHTEVNIGHICGKRHFGETFTVLFRDASRRKDRKFYLQAIRDLKAIAGRQQEAMHALMEADKGARWCSRAARKFRDTIPYDAFEALRDMARRGEAELYEEIEVAGESADIARELGLRSSWGGSARGPAIKRHFRGRLAGLESLTMDAGKLLYDLQQEFAAFLMVDPVNCKSKDVKAAADFAAQFASRLAQVEALVESGKRFFTTGNFQRFKYLPRITDSTRRSLESLAWDFEAGMPRGSRAA